MTDTSLSETVEQLEQNITSIGYTNTEVHELTPPDSLTPSNDDEELNSEETDQGPPTVFGIFVKVQAGPDFQVIAQEGMEYFQIQSYYRLWEDIAAQMDPETAKELVNTPEDEPIPDDHPIQELIPVNEVEITTDERRFMLAAVNLLTEMTEETRTDLLYHLTDLFTSSEVKHRVNTLSNHRGITSFEIYDKIFVYESLSLHDLSRTIERVRMATQRATIFLRYAFNLGVDIERTQSGPVNNRPEVESQAPSVDVFTETDTILE